MWSYIQYFWVKFSGFVEFNFYVAVNRRPQNWWYTVTNMVSLASLPSLQNPRQKKLLVILTCPIISKSTISTRHSVCIKIGEFQSCLASFGSYQIASTGYKQLGVGISLASLMNLIPIFFTTAAMVMESL